MKIRLIGLGLVGLLLVACGSPAQVGSLAEVAPLDPALPTFLYFYTDN